MKYTEGFIPWEYAAIEALVQISLPDKPIYF
jgi:hypothetical protein